MKFLNVIQRTLEDRYGAPTGLDVLDFVKLSPALPELGSFLVEQGTGEDLNVALLFDRDLLSAWEAVENARNRSVPFEEVSHFVYLSFNHNRGRSVTALEMEIQSEVDRILLAYHGDFQLRPQTRAELLSELFDVPYANRHPRYEEARNAAVRFLRTLPDPSRWQPADFERLRAFFHCDLGGKLGLGRPR